MGNMNLSLGLGASISLHFADLLFWCRAGDTCPSVSHTPMVHIDEIAG